MKQHIIQSKKVTIGYLTFTVPHIVELDLKFDHRYGDYIAETGQLFKTIDDGKWVFENEVDAKMRLEEIKTELFANQ